MAPPTLTLGKAEAVDLIASAVPDGQDRDAVIRTVERGGVFCVGMTEYDGLVCPAKAAGVPNPWAVGECIDEIFAARYTDDVIRFTRIEVG